MKQTSKFNEITFTDADVVNPDDFVHSGLRSFNPHNVRPFLLHDHGFTLAVVFADCLGDAIDIAFDAKKLNQFIVSDEELERDYPNQDEAGVLSALGNHGVLCDTEGLDAIELPNPAFSFCALFNANKE